MVIYGFSSSVLNENLLIKYPGLHRDGSVKCFKHRKKRKFCIKTLVEATLQAVFIYYVCQYSTQQSFSLEGQTTDTSTTTLLLVIVSITIINIKITILGLIKKNLLSLLFLPVVLVVFSTFLYLDSSFYFVGQRFNSWMVAGDLFQRIDLIFTHRVL